jgi:hypothetical protein
MGQSGGAAAAEPRQPGLAVVRVVQVRQPVVRTDPQPWRVPVQQPVHRRRIVAGRDRGERAAQVGQQPGQLVI